jgi:hypothetical protein
METQQEIETYQAEIFALMENLKRDCEKLKEGVWAQEDEWSVKKLRDASRRINENCSNLLAYREKLTRLQNRTFS